MTSSLSDAIEQRFGLPTSTAETVDANSTLTGMLSHRSCRKFTDATVSDDLLQTLFSAAFSAPSKSDLQQASVVRIADRAKQARLATLARSTAWVEDAPVLMVWCGDSRRIRRVSDWREHPFANDHLDAFMNAAVDVGIVMQSFIVAAESVGLGCCPISELRNDIERLSAELELPEWVFPVAGLAVGWPAEERPISLRLPLATTVHVDTYDDSDLLETVADYDMRREQIDQTPPEQQRMARKLGVHPDYGWSIARARQYSVPARDDFGSYIRSQGFDLS